MRKPLLLLCLFVLLASTTFAQQDSLLKRAVIIKTNPGLMAGIGVAGEFGGTIQISLTDSIAVFVGGGYNLTSPVYNPVNETPGYPLETSAGYTIRAGFYFFKKKHRFISFQFFYRKWANTTVYNYDFGNGDDGATTTDYTTDPLFSGVSGDASGSTAYYVNQSSVSVFDFALLYGRQMLLSKRHFFFEWYVGSGLRIKNINTEELGLFQQYITGGLYTPFTAPKYVTYSLIYPDLKAGFTIGFKF